MHAWFGHNQAGSKEGTAAESAQGEVADQFGMVVVFADVAEHNSRDPAIEIVFDEVRSDFVREMAATPHDTLFDRPWVWADAQHFEIVIGFEEQKIGLAQVDAEGIGNVAKVSGDAHLNALGGESIADRIGGIVRNGEAGDIEIADGEAAAGLEGFVDRRVFAPVDVSGSSLGYVDGDGAIPFPAFGPCCRAQAARVVAMFVGDQNGIKRGNIFPDGG